MGCPSYYEGCQCHSCWITHQSEDDEHQRYVEDMRREHEEAERLAYEREMAEQDRWRDR